MADDPQSLQEFTANLISDLSSGSISIHEALAACQQYAYLRDALETQKDTLARAELLGEDEFATAFSRVISEAHESISELPNFQQQGPDVPIPEGAVRDMGALREHAVTRLREVNRPQKAELRTKRREFIHSLVDRFSSTLPIPEQAMGASVDAAMADAAKAATTAQTRDKFTDHLLASTGVAALTLTEGQRTSLKNDIQDVLESHDDFFSGSLAQVKHDLPVYTALMENGGLARPDVFVDVAISAPVDEAITDTITRAVKLAQVAETLENPRVGTGKIQFFTSSGAKGVAAGLQKGADGLLSLVGEPVRDMVLHEKANGTLRSMLTSAQQFTDRLGETFVKSALFTHVAQDLTRQLAEKPRGGQVRTVFDDFFGSVFRGPLSPALAQGSQDRVLDYFELARANAAAPRGRTFLPSGPFPWSVFQIFEPFPVRAGREALERGSGRAGRFFPSVGMFGLGALSSLISRASTSFVDRITSFFFSSPTIGRQMAASRRAAAIPTPFTEDMPTMVALVVVITILLFFVLPTPFNIVQNSHSSKVSALFSSLRNIRGLFPGTDVDCTANPNDPLCTFKSCPTCSWPTSGYITQGPDVKCDTRTSHYEGNDKNGVDIGNSSGNVPVYAIDGGTVAYIYNGCGEGALGDNCGGAYSGYGNNIVIRFDNGYTAMYGHLNKAFNPAVRVGARVEKGTQIAWMNNTGNSSGQHLHFGVLSGGRVLDILPDSPLSKAAIDGCVASWLSESCKNAGKSCPAGTVSAQ